MRNITRIRELLVGAPWFWLVLLCIVVLGRGLAGDYVMDDVPVIQENAKITDLKYVTGYFTNSVWGNTNLGDKIDLSGNQLYRPLFLLTLNMGYHLWGTSQLGFHALNLFLHCVNTVLVFYIIAGLIPARHSMTPLFGAAIFAVHPIHVESIAWMAGLTDPLVSLFLFSAFLFYRRYTEEGRPLYAIITLLCYAAGLLSKEVAILFPFLLILYDWRQGNVRPWRYLPYLALLILYFIMRKAAFGNGIDWASFDLSQWPVLLEFISRYIQLLIIPWPLEYYYAKPATNLLAIGFGGILLAAAAGYLLYSIRRKAFLPLFALAWITLTLLPVLPVALLDEPVFALRVLYLPSVGVAMLFAWWFDKAELNIRSGYAAIGLLAAFSTASYLEVADWRDNTTFFTRAIETSPQAPEPYVGLAESYARAGEVEEAVKLNVKAASLAKRKADRVAFLEIAAELAGKNGDTANSERYYKEILQHAPQRSSAWVGLGNNALARRDNQLALTYYHNAYQADPQNLIASYNLALVYRRLGKTEMSTHFAEKARRLQVQQ